MQGMSRFASTSMGLAVSISVRVACAPSDSTTGSDVSFEDVQLEWVSA